MGIIGKLSQFIFGEHEYDNPDYLYLLPIIKEG